MIIVLTNDDGYQAEGLQTLESLLSQAGHEVWVCAPYEQRSAQSHAMTLKGNIRFTRYGVRHYYCNGTPVDCILYGLSGKVLPVIPDIVISGINHGYNASTDILYSATVAAASEAALRGLRAMAVSARGDRQTGKFPFREAARFVIDHLECFLDFCTPDVILNINVPPHATGQWRVALIGQLEYFDVAEHSSTSKSTSFDASSTRLGLAYGDRAEDANGAVIGDEITFSLRSDLPPTLRKASHDVDYHILSEGYISVTPLQVHPAIHEPTYRKLLAMLKEEGDTHETELS